MSKLSFVLVANFMFVYAYVTKLYFVLSSAETGEILQMAFYCQNSSVIRFCSYKQYSLKFMCIFLLDISPCYKQITLSLHPNLRKQPVSKLRLAFYCIDLRLTQYYLRYRSSLCLLLLITNVNT